MPTVTWPQYRDMTAEQALEWGEAERAARMADLQVRTADGLRQAQANAESRRKAIGATRSQASVLVNDAAVKARRAAAAGSAS